MGYDANAAGLLEATKDALKDLLSDNIATLATALARSDLWDGLTSVDTTMLFLGDPESVPPLDLAPLWVCIFGGETQQSGEQANLEVTGLYGYRYTFELTIRVYLHPEIFPSASPKTQSEKRERALDRVTDWLRGGVCNTHTNKTLTLTSYELSGDDEDLDVLNETHLKRVTRDDYYKNFGSMVRVRGIEATWVGSIE